jgi:hypothetical protein
VLELFPECEGKVAKRSKVREAAMCLEEPDKVQVRAAAKKSEDVLS